MDPRELLAHFCKLLFQPGKGMNKKPLWWPSMNVKALEPIKMKVKGSASSIPPGDLVLLLALVLL